jgi:hypothetical protein
MADKAADFAGTPQHIGIVACSAEGAALCYRTICDSPHARRRLRRRDSRLHGNPADHQR